MKFEPLPERLSARVRLAVHDVLLCAVDPRYIVDMTMWHTRATRAGKCRVCLAGAVMAQTLKFPSTASVTPSTFDDADMPDDESAQLAEELRELDEVRGGMFTSHVSGRPPDAVLDRVQDLITGHYDEDSGHAPWPIYLQVADILEAAGF